ncbi:MAG: hypothetical protein LR015_06325 [Verrucomicrobia bacterium]|nr:hypothetical protein [Verrucomicrobiota bacterium]
MRKGFFDGVQSGSVLGFMAGGDAALVRSIEGFEDQWDDGVRQMEEARIEPEDLVIGVTEGGETTWVLATVDWAAATCQSPPWLLFCNPADQLIGRLERCRRVLGNPAVRTWYLPTGPMAIAGSTRMQATSVQMSAVGLALASAGRPCGDFDRLQWMRSLIESVRKLPVLRILQLARTEAHAFLRGQLLHYQVVGTGITLLTDTTERSPTFSVLPFENDLSVPADALAPVLLVFPECADSSSVWHQILQREPRCLEWEQCRERTGWRRLQGFDLSARALRGRRAVGSRDWIFFREIEGAWHLKMDAAVGVPGTSDLGSENRVSTDGGDEWVLGGSDAFASHMLLKSFMNTMSTLSFTLAGRVESNLMVYARAANLKLIDRAIRTIRTLHAWRGGKEVPYAHVCRELFRIRECLAPQESVVLRTLEALK